MNVKINKNFFIIFVIVTFSSVFYFRDLTPINELKYISIVKETFQKGNFLTFYDHGTIYADKPPLYFWIIMLTKKLTGNYNNVILGLFSVIPAIIICLSMVRVTKKELTEKEGFLGIGMLMTTGIFAGGSLVLRMDMLMLMFIVLSLESFYKIYQKKNNKFDVYLMYIYIFLGVFTKGPVGILFPLVTVLLFFIREKTIKRVREFKPLIGLGILLTFSILWFMTVYLEGGMNYLYDLTIKQTAGRAYKAFTHVRPFYYYFNKIWITFLPWSFLYILTFALSLIQKYEKTSLQRFLSSAIIGNFIFMSFVSSKLDIYILPIYPFVTFYTLIILKNMKLDKLWQFSLVPFSVLMALALPLILIIPKFLIIPIKLTELFYLGIASITIFGIASLISLKRKKFERASWNIILGFVILVFSVSLIFPQINQDIGVKILAEQGKKISKEISSENYLLFNFKNAKSIDVYLDKEVPDITSTKQLKKIFEREKVILFVRRKDIKRNPDLKKILEKERLVWNSDKFYLYTNSEKSL